MSFQCPVCIPCRRLGDWRYWHPTRGSSPHVHHHEARAWVSCFETCTLPIFIHINTASRREHPHRANGSEQTRGRRVGRVWNGLLHWSPVNMQVPAAACVWITAKRFFHSTCFSAFFVLCFGYHFELWLFGNPTVHFEKLHCQIWHHLTSFDQIVKAENNAKYRKPLKWNCPGLRHWKAWFLNVLLCEMQTKELSCGTRCPELKKELSDSDQIRRTKKDERKKQVENTWTFSFFLSESFF